MIEKRKEKNKKLNFINDIFKSLIELTRNMAI